MSHNYFKAFVGMYGAFNTVLIHPCWQYYELIIMQQIWNMSKVPYSYYSLGHCCQ